MSDIVLEIKNEIIKRSNEFETITKGTKDEYNLYREHVKFVYKYATLLAKDKPVDIEIIQLCALLHDISMTNPSLDRKVHNKLSADMAEELLRKNNYPESKIQLIKKCILNHSSKRKKFRTTLEEGILVDADAMAHFDCIESIYSLAHNVMGLNEENSIQFVKDKLTKDYEEISESSKAIVKDKYDSIMKSKTIWNKLEKVVYRKIIKDEFDMLRPLSPCNEDAWMKYRNIRIKQLDNKEIDVFVIEHNGEFIGELTVNYVNQNLLTETIPNVRIYLEAFRLKKEYQGRGLGQELVKYTIDSLQKQGYTEFTIGVEDDNEIAKHIYFKYGFIKAIDKGHGNEFDSCEYTLYLKDLKE